MQTIDIALIVMAALASLTKLIDVFSTILRVNVHTERNPIGRVLFRRLGVKGGCWVTFVLWTAVCMATAYELVLDGGHACKIGVALFFCLLTYLNISTGLYNMKGIAIPLVPTFIRFYGWLGRKGRIF